MTTNFPSSADNFTNPASGSSMSSPSHSGQHADANDAIEAIETALLDGAPLHIDDANERVGIGTTTPAYKLDVNGVIDADNLTTYAKYLGTGISYDINRNKKVSHGLAVYRAYNGGSNAPTSYDIALQVNTTDSGMEFSASWLNSTAGPLYFRTLRDCCQNWTAWSTISLTAPSDIRTKTNVTEISNPRSIVEQLDAIEYDRINSDGTLGDVDPDELLDNMARLPRPREHGFVAQDLIQVLPFMVDYNPSFDEVNEHGWASAYTVQYERLVPVLTESIKELYAKTDAQEALISDLTARIEVLETA